MAKLGKDSGNHQPIYAPTIESALRDKLVYSGRNVGLLRFEDAFISVTMEVTDSSD